MMQDGRNTCETITLIELYSNTKRYSKNILQQKQLAHYLVDWLFSKFCNKTQLLSLHYQHQGRKTFFFRRVNCIFFLNFPYCSINIL